MSSCPWKEAPTCPWRGNGSFTAPRDLPFGDGPRPTRAAAQPPATLCLGVSFRTAPIAVREKLALSPSGLSAALARFGCGRDTRPEGLDELAIVGTCNRLELYAAGPAGEATMETLESLLLEVTGVGEEDVRDALYRHEGLDAVRHLCRVASGLESMVLGEPQILGQVSEAYSLATAHGSCGAVLSTVFRSAVRAGRRVREETAIARNAATVSSVAVKLATESVGSLDDAVVVVVGAGEMAELAATALKQRGVREIRVVSRTREHAAELAGRIGGSTVAFERLEEALHAADIVITSTAAPHVIITTEMADRAMMGREQRPLVFVDIALPRDVDERVSEIANVSCFDLDHLQAYVSTTLAEREAEIPSAEKVIESEVTPCMQSLRQLGIAPLIADLRARADQIRQRALDTALKHLSHLSDEDQARVQAFSEALLNKLLHEPTLRLKREAGSERAGHYAAAVRDLFGLATTSGAPQ